MSDFKPEPVLHLVTMEDTRRALIEPSWYADRDSRWNVKSDWIISLIDEIEQAGSYPYNADVQRLAESRLGVDPSPDSGNPLSTLVYNAQCYRRSDQYRAQGFAPLTQAMIDAAGAGANIETQGGTYNVREVNGQLHLMKPRARVYRVSVIGQPARIVTKRICNCRFMAYV
jgi:hypothetical protein